MTVNECDSIGNLAHDIPHLEGRRSPLSSEFLRDTREWTILVSALNVLLQIEITQLHVNKTIR